MKFLDRIMSNRRWARRAPKTVWAALVLLAISLLTAIPALAQTGDSVITGKVIDTSTKAPVADVVVTATSPSLQGEQIVVTDGTGSFRIPNLPVGDYVLRLEKETYKPYTRPGITLRKGATIRIPIELLPEALKSEEIVVVGRAPTVDVGSSTIGQSINQDFTRRIAVSPPTAKGGAQRSFEAVAEVAPGAHTDDFGTSINGTTSPENQYVVDGVSVNDPAYGIIGTPLTIEFIKEVNVVTGGYMPEYGKSTGGVLDVVTKSGGNDFHGSIFFNLAPGAFEGPRKKVVRDGQTVSTDFTLSSIRDYGFEVGGPIIKDKLWFFAGFDAAFTSRNLERNLNYIKGFTASGSPVKDPSTGFTVVDRVPGTQQFYRADQQSLQYIGKLTYQINQDNSVALSISGSPTTSGGHGSYGLDPQQGAIEVANIIGTYGALAHQYISNANDVALKWSSAFNNKSLLFDATFGWHHQRNATLPPDGSDLGSSSGLAGVPEVSWRRSRPFRHSITDFENLPAGSAQYCQNRTIDVMNADGTMSKKTLVPCPVQSYFNGGPGYIDDASLDRYQLKATVTSLFQGAGHHVVKAGFDGEVMRYDHEKAYSGTDLYREGGSAYDPAKPTTYTFNDSRMYGFTTGPDASNYVIQNTSKSASTSLSLGGFVQDSWNVLDKVTVNLGVRYDSQFLIGDDGKTGMALPNQWSPRIGVVYDFTQQGRSKLFANYARYYESVPLDIVDRGFGNESQITAYHGGGCNPNDAKSVSSVCQTDGNRITPAPRPSGPAAPYDPYQTWTPTGGAKTPVDPNVSPQSSDEIVLGGEYEIIQNGRLGLSYTKRWLNNVIEDMSRDEANTYFIGNPGSGIAKDFPKAQRNYDAVTFYFQKAFADLWLAQASYTVSYLRGNYAGLFRPETKQIDPNANSDFDLVSLTKNRYGTLPGDRTHEIKLFGAKAFPIPGGMLLDLGLTFRTHSGGPTDFWGSHPIYGADEVFILPRGSGDRLPWSHSIDGHVGYSFELAKDSQLSLSLDVFNLFNFQAVTLTDERYTSDDVLPCVGKTVADLKGGCLKNTDGTPWDPAGKNPNFGHPIQYQTPRYFRFGARVTF